MSLKCEIYWFETPDGTEMQIYPDRGDTVSVNETINLYIKKMEDIIYQFVWYMQEKNKGRKERKYKLLNVSTFGNCKYLRKKSGFKISNMWCTFAM